MGHIQWTIFRHSVDGACSISVWHLLAGAVDKMRYLVEHQEVEIARSMHVAQEQAVDQADVAK